MSNVEASQAGLYSGESLQLTDAVTTADGVDVVVAGDVDCNSQAVVGGDLRASGDVHLTNTCQVAGDVHAGGSVVLDSQANVAGSIRAVADVRIQSSTHVAGDVIAGGTVTSIDGLTHGQLVATGVIGGALTAGADVAPPDTTRPAPSTAIEPPAGGQSLTWTQWVNQTAQANNAPPWSAGLGESPGCTMAPWAASVNGNQVAITAPTVIDARVAASGCGTISLHGMKMKLGADVTIVADEIHVPNGLSIASVDGAPHRLTLLVPTAPAGCAQANAVEFSNGVTVDDKTALAVDTSGRVAVNGPARIPGRIVAGCAALTGTVTVATEPR